MIRDDEEKPKPKPKRRSAVCECGRYAVRLDNEYTIEGVTFHSPYCGICGKNLPAKLEVPAHEALRREA